MRFRRMLPILLSLCLTSTLAPHAQKPDDKDAAEIQAYVLTMGNATRTLVTLHQIKLAAANDPNLQKGMNMDSDDDKSSQSIAGITAKLSAYPVVVGIIAKNGFTPHELVVAELTLFQAGFAAAAVKEGASRDKLISEGAVSATNLDFVQQHQAELDELGKKYPIQ